MLDLIKSVFRKSYEDLSGLAFRDRFNATRGAVLLDVRTPDEFRSGTIKGAVNRNVMSPNFLSQMQSLDMEKTYFVFCRSGMRSANACSILTKAGYRVVNLKGGIGAWPAGK
jgi:rhodanese-related sulfurtransferase